MKEKDNIDQWLQKSMADFRPALSDSARERFLSEAPVTATGTSYRSLFGTLAVVILLSVTAIIWWSTDRPADTQVNDTKQNTSLVNQDKKSGENNTKVTDSHNQNQQTNFSKVYEQTPMQDSKSGSSTDNKVTFRSKTARAEAQSAQRRVTGSATSVAKAESGLTAYAANADKPGTEALLNNNRNETFDGKTGNKEKEKSAEVNDRLPVTDGANADNHNDSEANNNSQAPANVTDNNLDSKGGISEPIDNKGQEEKKSSRFMNQSLSLSYRPEIVWNVIDNEKLIHNFGAEWQTRLFSGDYLLGTGIGISLTRGYYEYAVEYNEFLGKFQQLDSITFEWNPREFSMQHTVHTTEETVFDTAVKVDYARVYRDFVYLQIPFTMGYDFVQKSKYTLGFRFVPILSVLLSKKPVDFRYEAGNDRIVQINRITPDRVRTNWQLNAGINYSRRLSETFWMEVEPRFTYYFNSVYEKSDNSSSPMGASIRVAVGIKY